MNIFQRTEGLASVSTAGTGSTDPGNLAPFYFLGLQQGRPGEAQPGKERPRGATPAGFWGGWWGGEQAQAAGFCGLPDFQPDLSPREEGPKSLALHWGLWSPKVANPADAASTSLGRNSHRARAGSTLQVWSQAMWDVKASGCLTRPSLSPTRRPRRVVAEPRSSGRVRGPEGGVIEQRGGVMER